MKHIVMVYLVYFVNECSEIKVKAVYSDRERAEQHVRDLNNPGKLQRAWLDERMVIGKLREE